MRFATVPIHPPVITSPASVNALRVLPHWHARKFVPRVHMEKTVCFLAIVPGLIPCATRLPGNAGANRDSEEQIAIKSAH